MSEIQDAQKPPQLNLMTLDDVPEVGVLERACFTAPWSEDTYRHEIKHNPRAFYYVLRPPEGRTDLPPILAYGGFWILGDEAHIVTLATHPELRRRRLGELMLVHLFDRAHEVGVSAVTLEVRKSNTAARELYRKWGFEEVGLRKRYYRDNNEDALLLTLFGMDTDAVWLPRSAALALLQQSVQLPAAPEGGWTPTRKSELP